MGAGRKTETPARTLAEAGWFTQRSTVNGSVSARNLGKKELAGVIFGCKNRTKKECLTNLIFGLPDGHFSYIRNIGQGMTLFLFNYSDRTMHGIFEAAGPGMRNINPYAWSANGTEATEYPAQVRVRIRKQCQPLIEEQFREVLHKNYYMDQKHFWFELDRTQTEQLISLFELSNTSRPSTTVFYNKPIVKLLNEKSQNLDTRDDDTCIRTTGTPDAGSSGFSMETSLPDELPCTSRKWVSLFKEKSDSDPRSTQDDNQLVSKDNWENGSRGCLNGTNIDSGPSVVTSCWEEAKQPLNFSHYWKGGITPSWEDETAHSGVYHLGVQAEAHSNRGGSDMNENTEYVAVTCVKNKLVLKNGGPIAACSQKENSKSDEEEFFLSRKTDSIYLEDEHCSAALLAFKMGNSVFEEEMKDFFVPHGMCDSDSEDGNTPGSPSTTDEFEDCSSNSSEKQSVIEELMQELKEVKAYAMDQHSRTMGLEKKLDDSGAILQYLQHRVMMLESHLQDPSVEGVEDSNRSCRIEFLTELTDGPGVGVDEMIYIMGGYDGVAWLPSMDCYSPSRDMLKSLKPMGSVRSHAAAAMLNGLIYNIGGRKAYGDNMWYDTVECYNPLSNKWIMCPPLSEKKGCLAAASMNDKIFAVGGGNARDCFSNVEVFDAEIGRWEPTKSMLQKRFASAAATLDGVLYVVGGYDGERYLKSVERYDPREGSWSKLQNMNTNRGSHALTVFRGKLYALGGYDGYKYVPSVEVFDPFMGLWVAGNDMKQSRGYFAAPVIGDTIYAIGGQSEGNKIQDTVDIYKLGHGWSRTTLRGVGKRSLFCAVHY